MTLQYRGKRDGLDDLWVAFEIECGLLELVIDFVDRFECVVLEDFLVDLSQRFSCGLSSGE
jgi:hypothetical protein